MTRRGLCICGVFPNKPCESPPTQEDLLCNPCRDFQIARDQVCRTITSSGVHSSGPDNHHDYWPARKVSFFANVPDDLSDKDYTITEGLIQ
jgi:hypothetical protein